MQVKKCTTLYTLITYYIKLKIEHIIYSLENVNFLCHSCYGSIYTIYKYVILVLLSIYIYRKFVNLF